MSEPAKSWGSTIIAGIIILVLVIIAVLVIYYIFLQPQPVPFPVSPFNYGDVIQIRPAVLTQYNLNTKDLSQDQYLRLVPCANNSCTDCYQPTNNKPLCLGGAQPNTCTATFTGKKGDLSSRWILNQWYDTASQGPKAIYSAKQNFTQFGNRFFLQNATATNIDDVSKLMTFMPFNGLCEWGPYRTFPLTGNDSIPENNGLIKARYDVPFVVYFLPTSQPNLFYILFPATNDVYLPPDLLPNTLQPNDGIASLRPFAQPENDTYNPWSVNTPNSNGLLLNLLKDVSPDASALRTNKPDIFLFEITKV